MNLCINCLKTFYRNHHCTGGCKIHKQRHNNLLHILTQTKYNRNQDVSSETDTIVQNTMTNDNVNNKNVSAHCSHANHQFVFLAMANILIRNNQKQFTKCRTLLDKGSQINFMTTDLVQ